jgi:sterol 3beta-glucosyltransferase
VHHGGAGTVHAVLRAGIPSVVVPFLADQPFWGRHLHRRGLAAPPVPYRRLTTDRLTDRLTDLPDPGPARAVGAAVRAEDGCAAVIGLLEEVVASRGPTG